MSEDWYLFKARGEDVPDVHLHIERFTPDYREIANQDGAFNGQAIVLEDALYRSLPGGVYDRLLAKMLERKATHFRVSHTEGEPKPRLKLKPGTQIAYIPDHANGSLIHPDVEFGFVTSVKNGDAFCRYWSKENPKELRTKSCSELTPARCLVRHTSHPQADVEALLEKVRGR